METQSGRVPAVRGKRTGRRPGTTSPITDPSLLKDAVTDQDSLESAGQSRSVSGGQDGTQLLTSQLPIHWLNVSTCGRALRSHSCTVTSPMGGFLKEGIRCQSGYQGSGVGLRTLGPSGEVDLSVVSRAIRRRCSPKGGGAPAPHKGAQ
ncbi:hypothetical protein EYF80_047981 [Liparis tanakae]|uniref:Uncharacterized protein n=1 Tax=Liparis tanakae TaxID=230148 RepID=A0A4Z2FKS0_9TELE|nr:hypothetical protein EYF80_047981 [Liparis tanakae]